MITIRSLIGSGVVVLATTAGLASTSYQPSDRDTRIIQVSCGVEAVYVSYTRRGPPRRLGVDRVMINGRPLARVELSRINGLLGSQRLAEVDYLGCRKTKAGDVRHWLRVEPAINASNASQAIREKSFYVRRGKIEVHDRPPAD